MLPALPLELWTQVLSSITDSCYLPRTWLNCRRVCHLLKVATEMAFIDVYLPQMTICVELAEMLELTYVGLSSDGEFADFKQSVEQQGAQQRLTQGVQAGFEDPTERIWQREHYRYAVSIEKGSPSMLYHTWLMGLVEDTGFPDLHMDITNRGMAFRWKPLLSTMFGEIEYRKWLLRHLSDHSVSNDSKEDRNTTDEEERMKITEIELHVRRIRPRNRAWNLSSEGDRRQEWQVNALQAYRTDDEVGLEENWGTFYNHVRPRYRLARLFEKQTTPQYAQG